MQLLAVSLRHQPRPLPKHLKHLIRVGSGLCGCRTRLALYRRGRLLFRLTESAGRLFLQFVEDILLFLW